MTRRLPFAIIVCWLGILSVLELPYCRAEEGDVDRIKEPELAKELRTRFESDQAIREKVISFQKEHKILDEDRDVASLDPSVADKFKALGKQMEDEDTRNRLWLKRVVQKHGWPGKSLVGAQASIHAWLLVQHADNDREFQLACLTKMEALPKGEVRPVDIAYLTDRILCGTGKKQKYGTQITVKEGKFLPQPIEDEEHVDERRKAVGLEPLADYLKMVEKVYGVPRDSESTSRSDPGVSPQ